MTTGLTQLGTSDSVHRFQITLKLLDKALHAAERESANSPILRWEFARGDRRKFVLTLAVLLTREERRAQFTVNSLLCFFSDLHLVQCFLVLRGHLEGALEGLLGNLLPRRAVGATMTTLLLPICHLNTQFETIRRPLVRLQATNMNCLAPDLVLRSEGDLVREWVDEARRLRALVLSPLAALIQVSWIIFIGPVLPHLLPYIRDIIVILLPQRPLISLIL